MKRTTLAALALACVLPATAGGQTYSTEEQELLDARKRCMDLYAQRGTEAVAHECYHPDVLFWASASPTPTTLAMAKEGDADARARGFK